MINMANVSGRTAIMKKERSGGVTSLVIGKHVYGNLYGVPFRNLTDAAWLTQTVKDAAAAGGAHVIDTMVKKFPALNGLEGGVSIIALLEESHISLHTWPEGDYATLDVYTCGREADPEIIFSRITEVLKPKHFKIFRSDRGLIRLGGVVARHH